MFLAAQQRSFYFNRTHRSVSIHTYRSAITPKDSHPPSAARMSPATATSLSSPSSPSPSTRILSTDDPCIVATKRLVNSVPGTLSLAQGIVHWLPPQQALDRAAAAVSDPLSSAYGPDEGMPALREALRTKIALENGLQGYDVHVTAGANQAFTNIVLALLDPSDRVLLWLPYYFNHQMAIQMAGGAENIIYGPCDPKTFHPDLDFLEQQLASPHPPKVCVLVNPCNPTGVLLSKEELDRAAALCAAAGTWLVVDNTYEQFVFDGREHHCPSGSNVIHIFSFSKAYGMMGWRVGYYCYPTASTLLAAQLLKIQDTIPICSVQVSQHAALGALDAGKQWVSHHVTSLKPNLDTILDALSPLGSLGDGIAGAEGAIYLWARLPDGCEDDVAVVEWLVRKHKICLIPGSSCGCPGHVRIGFANMEPEGCAEAAARLKVGLMELVAGGATVVASDLPTLRLQ